MAGRIFVNYRRGDDPGFTQALYQKLETEFGRDSLFMDVEGYIKAGDDFVHVLESQVDQSDVLLAVIGPRWIDAKNEDGFRRLDNPDDFVRIEIVSALEREKRVIPVLVNNAAMPRSDELPEPLKPLARRNARRLTIDRFAADCAGLVKDLRTLIDDLDAARAAKTESERQAAEEALRRKAEEEAARAAEAERQAAERARQQAVAGLSAEEIRKEEELANWRFVERSLAKSDAVDASAHIAELRNHIARFPGGTTERYARTELEEIVWKGLGEATDIPALESYIAEFPTGRNLAAASSRLGFLKGRADAEREAEAKMRAETEAWGKASGDDTKESYEEFLASWPASHHAKSARQRMRHINGVSASTAHWDVNKLVTSVMAILAATLIGWWFFMAAYVDRASERKEFGLFIAQYCSTLSHSMCNSSRICYNYGEGCKPY